MFWADQILATSAFGTPYMRHRRQLLEITTGTALILFHKQTHGLLHFLTLSSSRTGRCTMGHLLSCTNPRKLLQSIASMELTSYWMVSNTKKDGRKLLLG